MKTYLYPNYMYDGRSSTPQTHLFLVPWWSRWPLYGAKHTHES